MKTFTVRYTGDYLNEAGEVLYGDISEALLQSVAYVRCGFLTDQKPQAGEPDYWDRLYSLEIKPQHVAQSNGIIIFRPWVKASAFAEGAENLVAIGRAGAGYDKIDLDACTQNDVLVFNAPDTLTHSTASAALMFMLALAKRLPAQERLARSGSWAGQAGCMGDDLTGQTLGIIGLGKSGMELARLVVPFRMRVLAYSPHADPVQAARLGVSLVPSLEAVLREADYISLHCRLNDQTRRIIGVRELRLMKPTAYFVNVARGEMVDQEALVQALRERWIAGAGLDVFDVEPLNIADPLLTLDNVILTPHWLPSTRQAARATMRLIARGMLAVSRGELPPNIINPDVLERRGLRAKLAQFAENGVSEQVPMQPFKPG